MAASKQLPAKNRGLNVIRLVRVCDSCREGVLFQHLWSNKKKKLFKN